MFEPIQLIPEGNEKPVIDLNSRLNDFEITASDKIPLPQIALKIGDATIGTLGNILSLIGKAKSRKSFFIAIAIAVSVSKDTIFDLFKNELPANQKSVLYFDTEQGKYHVQMALKRICTTLCSGFFRQFALDNYDKIIEAYKEDFVFKFYNAYEKGLLKPMEGRKLKTEEKILELEY